MRRQHLAIFSGLIFLICICFVPMAFAQLTTQTGANIGFMENNPPNFTGWTARTGSYTNSNETTPSWGWNKTWSQPEKACDISYGGDSIFLFKINTNLTETDEHAPLLKKIPTDLGFTRSVRLGNTQSGGTCSELSYTMLVTGENCLVTFCYAMVLVAPHPNQHYVNPTFQVEITDDANSRVNDCCFFENCGNTTSSNITQSNLPAGWHLGSSGGYDQWIYCDWNQIAVNLVEYIGTTIKLKVRVSGCAYSAHGGYGYFVAKVGAPSISLSGCAGTGDTVTLAEAPVGYDTYEWFTNDAMYETPFQDDLDSWYESGTIVGTDRILGVTNAMMGDAVSKTFAVRLVSPTQHVSWKSGSQVAPACVTYIPATVNDMRPKFDQMRINRYIPTDPESEVDEVGFRFADVERRNDNYPLDWQMFDFGDGDSLEFKLDADNHWIVDSTVTTLADNHCRITRNSTNDFDIIYHTYQTGNYVMTRYAHSIPTDTTDTLECLKYDTLNIIVPIRPALQLTSVDTVCYGGAVDVFATSPGDIDAATYTYRWWYGNQDVNTEEPFFVGSTLHIDALTEDLLVHVQALTPDGFYNFRWDSVKVQQYPGIKIEGDTMICLGQQVHLTATDTTDGNLGLKWTYQHPTATSSTGDTENPMIFEQPIQNDTTIYIWGESTNHCFAFDSTRIVVVIPKVSANKVEMCVDDKVILTGSGAAEFAWTSNPLDASIGADSLRGQNPIEVSPDTTTVYTMIGFGQNGCQATTNITIKVVPDPVIKIAFSPEFVDVDEPTLMLMDSSDYAASSSWIFSDGNTAEGMTVTQEFKDLSVEEIGIHLISSNYLGCSSEGDTTVPVVLFSVWVPTGFTPDGDGMNDYFFFLTQNNLKNVTFEIFDRWGTRMYSYKTKEYEYTGEGDVALYGWDGKHNKEYVQNGTYIWRLTYQREGSTRVYDRTGSVAVVK